MNENFDSGSESRQFATRSWSLESGRSESSCQQDSPRKKAKAKRRSVNERNEIRNRYSIANDSVNEEESGKQNLNIVERIFNFLSVGSCVLKLF